jgi:hypothetical protein
MNQNRDETTSDTGIEEAEASHAEVTLADFERDREEFFENLRERFPRIQDIKSFGVEYNILALKTSESPFNPYYIADIDIVNRGGSQLCHFTVDAIDVIYMARRLAKEVRNLEIIADSVDANRNSPHSLIMHEMIKDFRDNLKSYFDMIDVTESQDLAERVIEES